MAQRLVLLVLFIVVFNCFNFNYSYLGVDRDANGLVTGTI